MSTQKQSHSHCPSPTKLFFHCSKGRTIGLWDISIISSVLLRSPYPLHEHMKFTSMAHSLCSLTWFVHLHHPSPTASVTEYAGSHSHVRWLLGAKGWFALYLLHESRQKGRKGGTGLALPLHRECLSAIHFINTTICQERGQIS